MAARVRAGEQVLTFVPSRRLAEEVARSAEASVRTAARHLTGQRRAGADLVRPSGGPSVLAYRAGYLASDRRLIERGLADGTVRGVAATNALELGVDIAGLDTVVLCGYPGSRAAFWQQAGRAGRRGGAAEVVLIARAAPAGRVPAGSSRRRSSTSRSETTVLDPASPPVLGPAAGGGRAGAAAAAGRRALVRGQHLGPGGPADRARACCAGDPTAGSGPLRSERSTGSACGAPMRTPSTSSRSPLDGCSARSGWTPPTWWCIPGRSICTRARQLSL